MSFTSSGPIVNTIWEWAHNRVTANVLNRIKQLGEWRIDNMKNKELIDAVDQPV